MTFVGKLLVIIQLVLSLCFMAMAGAVYTTNQAWKVAYNECKADVEARDKDLERITGEKNDVIDELKQDLTAAETRASDAENDRRAQNEEFQARQIEIDRLTTILSSQTALATIAGEEATVRRDEALTQRRINEGINIALNGQNAKVSQLEDQVFNQQVERKSLVTRYDEMLKENATYRRVLAANGFDTDIRKYERQAAPTPLVYGKVVGTKRGARGGRELVEVSIGSDDGMDEGTTLYVYRTGERNRFLGEIRLELVTPDRSVGVVVLKAKNGVIEREDYVATKL